MILSIPPLIISPILFSLCDNMLRKRNYTYHQESSPDRLLIQSVSQIVLSKLKRLNNIFQLLRLATQAVGGHFRFTRTAKSFFRDIINTFDIS